MQEKSEAEKAYWKEEERRMKGIIRSLRAAYTHDCFKEKRPDACYNLADIWSGMDMELKKAHDLYERMCLEHRHAHSCFKYGAMKRIGGNGIEKNEDVAIESLGYACEQSINPEACYQHAMAVALGSDEKYAPDEKASFKSLVKACDMGHGASCYFVAKHYYDGLGGAPCQDKRKAVEFAKQACLSLKWEGCQMVWKMFEEGDGVEKNPEIARRYRVLTRGIREQLGLD